MTIIEKSKQVVQEVLGVDKEVALHFQILNALAELELLKRQKSE